MGKVKKTSLSELSTFLFNLLLEYCYDRVGQICNAKVGHKNPKEGKSCLLRAKQTSLVTVLNVKAKYLNRLR